VGSLYFYLVLLEPSVLLLIRFYVVLEELGPHFERDALRHASYYFLNFRREVLRVNHFPPVHLFDIPETWIDVVLDCEILMKKSEQHRGAVQGKLI